MLELPHLGQTVGDSSSQAAGDGGARTARSCRENVNLKLWGKEGSGNSLLCELCLLLETTTCHARGWGVPGWVKPMYFIP